MTGKKIFMYPPCKNLKKVFKKLDHTKTQNKYVDSEDYTWLLMKQNRNGNNKRRNTKEKPMVTIDKL